MSNVYKQFSGIERINGKICPLYEDIVYDLLLTENNSGCSDHKIHDELSRKVTSSWMDILNRISKKDIPLEKCEDISEFEYTEIIDFKVLEDYDLPEKILKKYTLETYILLDNTKDQPIVGGSMNFGDNKKEDIIIILKVNPKYSIRTILRYHMLMNEISSHETTHFIKHIYGMYQKSFVDFKHPEQSERNRLYLKYKHEFESNIPMVNTELKNIKDKLGNITFGQALQHSRTWNSYVKYVFNVHKDLKNIMLKKCSYYWTERLKGKLK